MPKIKVKLNDKQMEILDHFRETFGMSRPYAIRFLLIDPLSNWRAGVMERERNNKEKV